MIFESVEAWKAKARELFGDNFRDWRFQCPVCKHVASPRDFKELGADPDGARRECIGRHLPKDKTRDAFGMQADGYAAVEQPCNYAGYGLIQLSPVRVKAGDVEIHCFAFAPSEAAAPTTSTPSYPEVM